MLWTIMPEDLILSNSEQIKNAKEVRYQGRLLLVSPLEGGKMCVMRIVSGNPRDYLDPRFQPGTVIDRQ